MSLKDKVLLLVRALSHVWWQSLQLRLNSILDWLNAEPEKDSIAQMNYINQKKKYEMLLPEIKSWWWTIILFNALIAVVIALAIGWTAWTAFQGLPDSADPKLRNIAPTPISQPQAREDRTPLQGVVWLTSEQVLELRNQENVINIALIDTTNVKYAQDLTVILDEDWKQVQPLKVSSIAVLGTAVTLSTSSGENFVFNTFQPFVFVGQPSVIHMVDHLGNSWSQQMNEVEMVPLEEGRQSLPVTVNPNAQLSFSN